MRHTTVFYLICCSSLCDSLSSFLSLSSFVLYQQYGLASICFLFRVEEVEFWAHRYQSLITIRYSCYIIIQYEPNVIQKLLSPFRQLVSKGKNLKLQNRHVWRLMPVSASFTDFISRLERRVDRILQLSISAKVVV